MTLAQTLTATKDLCSISGTSFDTYLNREINFGQADFSRDLDWTYLERVGSLAGVANQYIYTLPSDFDSMKAVMYQKVNELSPVSYARWIQLNKAVSSGTPRFYIIHEGDLKIYPAPGSAAATTPLSGAISSSSATSITVDATASFDETGRGIVNSEVVRWQNTSSTQLLLVTRGVEGTTAATHSDNDVFTYRDIEYSYYRTLADITANDTSVIPARYHEAMVFYAAGMFFHKQENETKARLFFGNPQNPFPGTYFYIKEQAKRDLGVKQQQKFTTVLGDTEPTVVVKDNTYPQDGSIT